MSAGKYDMSICQGSDYELGVTIKDSTGTEVDLTGHTFTGQIRKTASDSIIQASFTFEILDQILNRGRVNVKLNAATSSGITLDKSKSSSRKITVMTYDIESVSTALGTKRWLEGKINFSPEVTK